MYNYIILKAKENQEPKSRKKTRQEGGDLGGPDVGEPLCTVLVKNCNKKVKQSHYRPEVPRGFQEVKVPRLRDSGPGWW